MTKAAASASLSVVKNGFAILERINGSDGMGVTELADDLDMPKSTLHGYLKTLVDIGYLINDDGRYRTSYKVLNQAGLKRKNNQLFEAAKSHVHELANETGEVVNLGVDEGGHRIILEHSQGPNAIWDDSFIGHRTNLHMTAMGKAMLAWYPEDRVEAILDTHGLLAATDRTITDPDALFEELERIRERGYSIEDEEHRDGFWALGSPIIPEDTVIGAVGISGPKSRMAEDSKQEHVKKALLQTCNVIELEYRY